MSFIIGGLQKTSFLDYPEKISCIVFSQGCNFRCGYCHNPELINRKKPNTELSAFFDFLKSRTGKLDGIVVTGGEPTLQKDLKSFIKEIKNLNFKVKLDTNGSNPKLLLELLQENLLDYIAMDIKAPLSKYEEITRVHLDTNLIEKSIELITQSNIDYEFRTTVIKKQLLPNDFDEIGQIINGARKYFIQKFIPSKILNPDLINEKSYSDEELELICEKMKKYVDFCTYR